MTMLSNEAKKRILKFITDLEGLANKGLHSNAASQQLYKDMMSLAIGLRDDDNVKKWMAMNAPNLKLFEVMDAGKLTGTPDIFNEESKAVTQLYLQILKDLKTNYKLYIPGPIRLIAKPFKLKDKIQARIDLIEAHLARYQEKEQALDGGNHSVVQRFHELKTQIASLANTPSADFNAQAYAQKATELHKAILAAKLPKMFPSKPLLNADSIQHYQHAHRECLIVLGESVLLEELLQAEKAVNQALLGAGTKPMARTVCELIAPQVNAASASAFKTQIMELVTNLIASLDKYARGRTAHKDKVQIAQDLASQLRQAQKNPSVIALLMSAEDVLRNVGVRHQECVIANGISAGNFGEMLQKSSDSFSALTQQYSVARNLTLLQLCQENSDLLKQEPAKPLLFTSK